MYDLMQLNITTMGSREIAKLTDKDHKHVIRDAEMLNEVYAYMSLPKIGQCDYKADNGQTYKEYVFNQEQCVDLITGYSREIRIKVNRRWQDLEKGIAKPAFQIPQTLGEALQLAANQALQIEQDAPKVAHYNAVADRSTLLNATQVAHSVGLKSPQSLNDRLKKIGVYNGAIKRGKAFQSWFIEDGLGVMKQGSTGHMQPLFTTKGQIWVFELLGGDK